MHRKVGKVGAREMKAPDCHVRESNMGASCDLLTRLQKPSLKYPYLSSYLNKQPCCKVSWLWEGNLVSHYLLSDNVGVMAGLNFEGAVVGP